MSAIVGPFSSSQRSLRKLLFNQYSLPMSSLLHYV
jgi:hypothetical protein